MLMTPFLKTVAHDLFAKTGGDFRDTAIIFPNKRAGLFFNEYLACESTRPIWAPAYISINELFCRLSSLKTGDSIRLVCELYEVFCRVTGSREMLDDFYFWGELLISDFDDVDKNLVDADLLFRNLKDLKDITDNSGFLDKEQAEAIGQFFRNFSLEKHTELKGRFAALWNKMGEIYHGFRQKLLSERLAYEGMLYRDAIERIEPEALPYGRFVFVGFNALNKVEYRLFSTLRDAGKAMFYWDYDTYYTPADRRGTDSGIHEAGTFILRNLKDFPNELPVRYFQELGAPKEMSFISASTENAQARFIYDELTRLKADGLYEREKESAVVLCNESLLLPVLHSIPDSIKSVNVTMGFPLSQTPIFGFINAYMELQTNGYYAVEGHYGYDGVQQMLKHPYVLRLSAAAGPLSDRLAVDNRFYPRPSELQCDDFLRLLFHPIQDVQGLCGQLRVLLREVATLYQPDKEESHEEESHDSLYDQLYRESLFKAYTLINRFYRLAQDGILSRLRTDTFRRLLNRLLSAATIPFHGEPAVGLQVMGLLETRNLDFRNLIMLSVNEGRLPKTDSETSFIPYNLRKAFGMTTVEHRNAIYAYYFYRLLQRAERITLLYNKSTSETSKGEMSRFMLQLLSEWPGSISFKNLEAIQTVTAIQSIQIEKTPEVMRKLFRRFDADGNPKALLSPSALNTYLDCRLKFYYYYIEKLIEPDEVSAEIDSALFGTLFHKAAELAYRDLTSNGPEIRKEDLQQLLNTPSRLQAYVDRAFKEDFFHVPSNALPQYNGTQLINNRVITRYLRQLIRNDLQYAPFKMVGMERTIFRAIPLDTPYGQLTLHVGGKTDRMDCRDDILRIVDYKTGGQPKIPEDITQLFTPGEKRPGYVFQAFLYAYIASFQTHQRVAPALLYIHKAASDTYSPVIEMGKKHEPVTDFSVCREEFHEHLMELLCEIFCSDQPFTQTGITRYCEFCDFRRLCKR